MQKFRTNSGMYGILGSQEEITRTLNLFLVIGLSSIPQLVRFNLTVFVFFGISTLYFF